MSQYDDDLAEMKARMAATRLRDSGRFAKRLDTVRAVPVRALPIPGTRDFALEPVGPGWQVFAAGRRLGRGEDDMALAEKVGGVVVEAVHDRVVDDETGEVLDRTRYRCLATWHPEKPWHTLDAGEVDRDHLAGLDRMASTVAIRWLLRPVVASTHKTLSLAEIAAITDAYRLTVAVAG